MIFFLFFCTAHIALYTRGSCLLTIIIIIIIIIIITLVTAVASGHVSNWWTSSVFSFIFVWRVARNAYSTIHGRHLLISGQKEPVGGRSECTHLLQVSSDKLCSCFQVKYWNTKGRSGLWKKNKKTWTCTNSDLLFSPMGLSRQKFSASLSVGVCQRPTFVTVHEKTRYKSEIAILDNAHLKVQTVCYFMLKSDVSNGDKITSVWDNAVLFSACYSSLVICISSAET